MSELLDDLHLQPHRHPGTAVFLADDHELAPFAMRWLLERESVLHERTLVLSWRVDDKPSSPPHETSVRVEPLDGRREVVGFDVTLGYRDRLDVEVVLRHAVERQPARLGEVTLDRLPTDRVEQLDLPRDRAVIIGREFAL